MRAYLIIFCLFTCLIPKVLSQTMLPDINAQPDELYKNGYLDMPPELQVKTDVDNNVIRYFFDFSCEYCRSVQDLMEVWSTTLPDDYRFVYHHAGSSTSVLYYLKAESMTYIANLDIPAEKKHTFMKHLFNHINKIETTEMMMRLLKEAVTDIDVPMAPFLKYIGSPESKANYIAAIDLQRQIKLAATPSVLIGGRFYTHLGLVDGRPERWIELLNKVTSVHYYMGQQAIN